MAEPDRSISKGGYGGTGEIFECGGNGINDGTIRQIQYCCEGNGFGPLMNPLTATVANNLWRRPLEGTTDVAALARDNSTTKSANMGGWWKAASTTMRASSQALGLKSKTHMPSTP